MEEGLSHSEIQLRLNIPARTYFHWLDLLFREEQKAIEGNNYTYQRLLNETLILNQRYLRRARKLTEIGDDVQNVDAEQRIEAHRFAAQLERAAHDMTYFAPSYLKIQGLLPPPEPKKENDFPALALTAIEDEEKDPLEKQRMRAVGEYRRDKQKQKKQQQHSPNPLAYTPDTYNKIQENKRREEMVNKKEEEDEEDEDAKVMMGLSPREKQEEEARWR